MSHNSEIFLELVGFYFSEKLYSENSFAFNEWYDNNLKSTSFEVKTIKTMTRGVCFTISFPNEMAIAEFSHFFVKRSFDILVYLHNEGDEFWLLWKQYPIEMTSLKFYINSR